MSKWKIRRFVALWVVLTAAQAQNCDKLQKEYDKDKRLPKWVSVGGFTRDQGIELWWGHDAGRAEAALLQVLLQRQLGYQGVRLRCGPPRLEDLARKLPYDPYLEYRTVAVAVAAQWRGESGPNCTARGECGPAGPRLRLLGVSSASAQRSMHVRASCLAIDASFADLAACTFDTRTVNGTTRTVVYYVTESKAESCGDVDETERDETKELQACIAAAGMYPEPIARRHLLERLEDTRWATLFVDYEVMWGDASGVRPLPGAPCSDGAAAVRATDVGLELYEPALPGALHDFRPPPAALRAILRAEAGGEPLEEAACRAAAGLPKMDVVSRFFVNVQLCLDDPDFDGYLALLERLDRLFVRTRSSPDFEVRLRLYRLRSCANLTEMMTEHALTLDARRRYATLGLVAPGPRRGDARELALQSARADMPLVLYSELATPAPGALSSAGDTRPLARALARLAGAHGWRRVAVLADDAPVAEALVAALAAEPSLQLHRVALPRSPTRGDADAALRELRRVDARIVLVDASAAATAAVVAAARDLGATDAAHAWIVREWNASAAFADVRVYALSYWSRVRSASPSEPREECGDAPPRAEAIAAAAVTLKSIYEEIVANSTRGRYDLHSPEIFRKFHAAASKSRPGPCGRTVQYEGGARVDPAVYLDEWRGVEGSRLGTCTERACELRVRPNGEGPGDGGDACWLRWTPFAECRDYDALAGALGAAALGLAAGAATAAARRGLRRHVAKRESAVRARLLAGKERALTEVAGRFLVPRDALLLHEELGAGRFGRVRRAELRLPGRQARPVAAKAPRMGAAPSEEAELLREACALAALDHEHVVRLAGVVADDGPPLVLMEHALFGDLRRYLRARRALAGAALRGAGGEAAHVGPAQLTRLLREAAAALAYLARSGLVHRDVRAANCLLDARRRLRLGDFGMARRVRPVADAGAEPEDAGAEAEYACRSRALFPVLWMAPESLERGAFSAASDVWALGVLLLELVTLGERPFGDEAPLRVLRFVLGGGRPPLPRDASAQSRAVALACWRRTPQARPSAAQLEAYLGAHPCALRPALAEPRSASTDSDSGFGEPPSPDAESSPCGLGASPVAARYSAPI